MTTPTYSVAPDGEWIVIVVTTTAATVRVKTQAEADVVVAVYRAQGFDVTTYKECIMQEDDLLLRPPEAPSLKDQQNDTDKQSKG
jgi:hypothetical protein